MNRLSLKAVALLAVPMLAALLLGGCPATNTPPVANAGTDQTVSVNAIVQLNGAGSSDADGNTLTFTWTQTAGTAVTLTNGDTAAPTFIAPAAATSLTFQLSVSDGTDTATDTVTITVQETAPVVQRRLYVACFGVGNRVLSFLNPESLNGNIAPDTNLSGAQTLLNQPTDVVVTSNDTLIVTNFVGNSATSYANADATNGNIAPSGNVAGAATGLVNPVSLAINTANDLVFAANAAGNVVLVFGGASTAAFNGNLAPIRTITSANINTPRGINFGGGDVLYVANAGGAGSIAAFNDASTRNGTVSADRVITSAAFSAIFDVFIDAVDRMYVVNSGNDQILVFNNASTLNGARNPDSVLTVTGAGTLTAIAVDDNGVGYVVDNAANAVYAYDNIAARNGAFAPDRTLAGANTQLQQPIRVFLVE